MEGKLNNRIEWLDLTKSIAIVLVVMGHIIQYVCAPNNFGELFSFSFIYSFHMPLFMFISGYLTWKKKTDIKWLKKKFYSYFIPFAVWTIICFFTTNLVNEYTLFEYLKNVIKSPDWSRWFLLVLFECDLVLFIDNSIYKTTNKNDLLSKIMIYLFSAIILILIRKYITRYFGISLLSKHFLYYIIGNIHGLLENNNETYKTIFDKKPFQLLIIILFFILVIFYRWSTEPLFVNYLKTTFLNERLVNRIIIVYYCALAICGVFSTIFVSKFIDKFIKNKNYYLGRHTKEIYIIHYYLIRMYTSITVINVMLSFVLAIVVPIIIKKIISKSRVLDFILFGTVEKQGVTV